jgi:hypothetical protein
MFLSGKNQITEIIEETISNIEDSSNKLSEMIKDQENQKTNMNAFQHSFRPKDSCKWNSEESNYYGSINERIS